MIELEELGYGHRDKHDKQDFIWTDLDMKEKLWKNIEYKQLRFS